MQGDRKGSAKAAPPRKAQNDVSCQLSLALVFKSLIFEFHVKVEKVTFRETARATGHAARRQQSSRKLEIFHVALLLYETQEDTTRRLAHDERGLRAFRRAGVPARGDRRRTKPANIR